jgi:hypothetical protein
MIRFKLTPNPDCLSDPIWQHSEPPHEPCCAIGETENDARANAATNFRPMRQRLRFEKIVYDSPWLDPKVTTCELVEEVDDYRGGDYYAIRQSEVSA